MLLPRPAPALRAALLRPAACASVQRAPRRRVHMLRDLPPVTHAQLAE